jgi:hypothetical protein
MGRKPRVDRSPEENGRSCRKASPVMSGPTEYRTIVPGGSADSGMFYRAELEPLHTSGSHSPIAYTCLRSTVPATRPRLHFFLPSIKGLSLLTIASRERSAQHP